jgi:hypothetical protein
VLTKLPRKFIQRAVLRHRDDLGSRDHCFFHGCLGKFEDAVDKTALFLVHVTALFRYANQLSNLVFGVYRCVLAVGMQSENADRPRTRPVEGVNERFEDLIEDLHRQRDRHRYLFRELQSKKLRSLLAEYDMKRCDDDEGDRVRNEVTQRLGKVADNSSEYCFDDRFAQRTKSE